MLRIIDGKRYDTETANLICDISPNDFHYGDFRYESTHLYRTGKGTWFIAGEGGPLSRWAQPVGQSSKCSGEGIQIITDEEARDSVHCGSCHVVGGLRRTSAAPEDNVAAAMVKLS